MNNLKSWLEDERKLCLANHKAAANGETAMYMTGRIHLLDTILDLFEEELK